MRGLGLETVSSVRQVTVTGDAISLDLSFPPSTNNLFLNVQGRGRVPSRQYKEWREENGWRIKAARVPRLSGPVEITLEVEDRPGRRDLDNCHKAPIDLLVEHGVIEGDHRGIVRAIKSCWANVQGVRVTVRPLATGGTVASKGRGAA